MHLGSFRVELDQGPSSATHDAPDFSQLPLWGLHSCVGVRGDCGLESTSPLKRTPVYFKDHGYLQVGSAPASVHMSCRIKGTRMSKVKFLST